MRNILRIAFCLAGSSAGWAQSAFSGGSIVGNAGLYQINFHVPQVAPDIPACGAQNPFNLTMTIQGTSSADQASFCVQP
jgi:hypothetical protein